MEVTRYCKRDKINWKILPELNQRLEKLGLEPDRTSIRFEKYQEEITYNDFNNALQGLPPESELEGFSLFVNFKNNGHLHLHSSGKYYCLTVDKVDNNSQVDSIMDFFGLKTIEPNILSAKKNRTIFIAHKFNDQGKDCSMKVARYLELLGFQVKSGHSFSPKSVSQKVQERIESQEVILVILTVGDDSTWLVQETAISKISGKPLIILKEKEFNFKPGILADHEYIEFTYPDIEKIFIHLLEGLRELGYEFLE